MDANIPTPPEGHRPDFDRRLDRSYFVAQVVFEAAELDVHLRGLCSALVGSKYGAIISAGQSSSWLIDTSLALARAHDDIEDYATDELKEILDRCRLALKRRNMLVHGIWSEGADGHYVWMSRLRSIDGKVERIEIDDIEDLTIELRNCWDAIHTWVHEWAPDHVGNDVQLRWEAYLLSLTPEEREKVLEYERREGDEAQ